MSRAANWFCAQMGAREHYSIPRALHSSQALEHLFTDYWAGNVTQIVARHFSAKTTKSLASRVHADVPSTMVRSCNLRSIAWEAQLRRMSKSGGVAGRYLAYCEIGKKFANAALTSIQPILRLSDQSVFFGYDTCSLEVMQKLKERGVFCILGQIDPCRVEIDMVQAEQLAWPGWQSASLDVPDEFYQRHHDEWKVADRIVVNSTFSRDALTKQGVPSEKIDVVALSYELSNAGTNLEGLAVEQLLEPHGFTSQHPLRVLFLGQVMLRKGIQYLIKAAEQLRGYPVVIDVVGPLHITEQAIRMAPLNVHFHGRATRDDIGRWYRNSHVFVLPTLSDGFAITQLEAMAHGLAVIATPNCGDVVSTGTDGFLVPPRDHQSITDVVQGYLADPSLLASHRRAALTKASTFSLKRLAASLLAITANRA